MDEKLSKSFSQSAEHLLSAKEKGTEIVQKKHCTNRVLCGYKGKKGGKDDLLEETFKMSRISAGG